MTVKELIRLLSKCDQDAQKDETYLMESIRKRKALEEAGAIVQFVEPCEIRYDDGYAKAALSVYVVIGG